MIPASYYYEWEHFTAPNGKARTGRIFLIQPVGATVTYLCGLYRLEDDLPIFTVLTREPSDELKQIHDRAVPGLSGPREICLQISHERIAKRFHRMPLIIPGDKIAEWINADSEPDAILSAALTNMIFEPVDLN